MKISLCRDGIPGAKAIVVEDCVNKTKSTVNYNPNGKIAGGERECFDQDGNSISKETFDAPKLFGKNIHKYLTDIEKDLLDNQRS